MNREDVLIRTGFGVLTESAPAPPSFDEITTTRPERRPIRRTAYAIGVLGLAVLVFVGTVVLDSGMRLAYATAPGLDLTYIVNSENTVGDETFTAGPAAVGYGLSDAGDGLIDVRISYEPLEGCGSECGPGVSFTQTVTEAGDVVTISGLTEDQGIPGFVIPVPIPAAGVIAGFPRFLGPPLPEHDLRLGDTWETDENDVVGQHQLVDQTQVDGRDVVIIESAYSYIHPHPDLGEYTASSTVWFDPADGIVVQAQIIRNSPPNSQGQDRTTQMDFKLDG